MCLFTFTCREHASDSYKVLKTFKDMFCICERNCFYELKKMWHLKSSESLICAQFQGTKHIFDDRSDGKGLKNHDILSGENLSKLWRPYQHTHFNRHVKKSHSIIQWL